MTDPKQSPAKVVLNAITYKELPGKHIGVPEPISIDITDLLEENKVSRVFGITNCPEGSVDNGPCFTQFVINEPDIVEMEERICNIIDACIVNANQGKAIKRLIDEVYTNFRHTCWEKIGSR